MTQEERKRRIAQALIAQARYGDTLTQDNQTLPAKPKWKVTPKGTNPLKGRYGFKAEVKF